MKSFASALSALILIGCAAAEQVQNLEVEKGCKFKCSLCINAIAFCAEGLDAEGLDHTSEIKNELQ